MLLTASLDNCLSLVDIRTFKRLSVLRHDTFQLGSNYAKACFSPVGSTVAAPALSGEVFLWNITQGSSHSPPAATLPKCHSYVYGYLLIMLTRPYLCSGAVHTCVWGKNLISGGADANIVVWE